MSGSSFAQAQAELTRIDLLIRRAVILTQLAGQSPDDPLRGLYVSDDRTAALAARSFAFAARHQPCLPPGEQAAFDTAIRQARKQSRLVAQQARRAGCARAVNPAGLLQLQRAAGNRAVNRLIQTRLIVGPANDPYEREAERMAARFGAPTSAADLPAQRIQALPQTPEIGPEGGEAGDDIERQLAATKGTGAPLPPDTRAMMEHHFGTDFSGVRVHTGAAASHLNRQLGAQAFTYGADIYMNDGKYNPRSSEGQRLLAHELTHVTQQQAAPRVRRLMSPADFKKQTTGRLGGRSKTDFTVLDQLLDEYSRLGWGEADILNRNTKLDDIDRHARLYRQEPAGR